jgi:CBS domain-containing protein
MPSNLILGRVLEFLSSHSPFDLVAPSDLENISESVEIVYFEDRKIVFKENDSPGDHCYLVRKGRVNLIKKQDGEEVLMDVCGEGDLFGIRSMLSNDPYKMTAIVKEEALLYAIPVERMRPIISDHPAVARFFAEGLASGQIVMGHKKGRSSFLNLRNQGLSGLLNQQISQVTGRPFLICGPEESIRAVSTKMSGKGIDSAVITNENVFPLGIITDTDLRNRVATGQFDPGQPVKKIMSSPVISIRSSQNLGEVSLKMMNFGVHHLCITEDGTSNSPVKGVISNHDLLMFQGSSPTIILKIINKTESKDELKKLFSESEKIRDRFLPGEMPVHYVMEVIASLRDATTRRMFDLILKDKTPDLTESFCWIDLGSSGRKEQILKTDLDNVMILSDQSSSSKKILLEVAEEVNDFLMDCGYSPCPAGIMGHLPAMCRTAGEWDRQFKEWIYQPDSQALMNSTIFFDMREIQGDGQLVSVIKRKILDYIRKQPSFLNFLAKNAIQNPPPLSFFNQFVVETSGEHKNEFDIKKRAIMPLVDSARLFALEHDYYDSVSTLDRFRSAASLESRHRKIFDDAIQGYEFLLKIRARSGLLHRDDGRFIDISSFDNIEKKIFKEIFHIIRELQKIIHVRFQLDFFH